MVSGSVSPNTSKNLTSCLLARGIFVPAAIAPHDLEQLINRLFFFASRVMRHREVITRLMIGRVFIELRLQLIRRATLLRLIGKFDRRARGIERLVFGDFHGRFIQHLFRAVDIARRHQTTVSAYLRMPTR